MSVNNNILLCSVTVRYINKLCIKELNSITYFRLYEAECLVVANVVVETILNMTTEEVVESIE